MRQVDTPVRDLLGEGPVWDATEQVLWWVDIAGEGLRRLRPSTGAVDFCELPEPVGSVAPMVSGGTAAGKTLRRTSRQRVRSWP